MSIEDRVAVWVGHLAPPPCGASSPNGGVPRGAATARKRAGIHLPFIFAPTMSAGIAHGSPGLYLLFTAIGEVVDATERMRDVLGTVGVTVEQQAMTTADIKLDLAAAATRTRHITAAATIAADVTDDDYAASFVGACSSCKRTRSAAQGGLR